MIYRNNAIQGNVTVNAPSIFLLRLFSLFYSLELTLNDRYRTNPCSAPYPRAYRQWYAEGCAYSRKISWN